MTTASAAVTFRQVLRNRRFFALWLAQLVSSFGDWLALVALFSLVTFQWKASPYEVSTLLLAFVVPYAVLGPLAGVFVDRWNLKRTMIGSDLVRAPLVAGFVFATEPWQLYALIATLSAVSCFFLPAQGAMIPLLVRREELLVANSINAQTIQLNKIIGPAAAGLLVAWAGEKLCFLLDAVSFVISAALLARITAQRSPVEAARGAAAVVRHLREGLDFLWHHRALRFVVLAMVTAIFAIGAFDALIAVYVRDVLAAESRMFGALISIVGMGTIIGSLLIGKYGRPVPRVLLVVAGIFCIGVGVGWLAFSGQAFGALGASLFLGFAASGVMVPAQTLTQEETPQALLGRVSSTSISLITVAQLIAIAAAGKLAEWLGIRNLYYLLAAALVLTGAIGYVYARANRLVGATVPPAEI